MFIDAILTPGKYGANTSIFLYDSYSSLPYFSVSFGDIMICWLARPALHSSFAAMSSENSNLRQQALLS